MSARLTHSVALEDGAEARLFQTPAGASRCLHDRVSERSRNREARLSGASGTSLIPSLSSSVTLQVTGRSQDAGVCV